MDKIDFTDYTLELKDYKKRVDEFKTHVEKAISIIESMVAYDVFKKLIKSRLHLDFKHPNLSSATP
jgi:hypothetical protein